jgi:hypothetical protein
MTSDGPSLPDDDRRVVRFRRNPSAIRKSAGPPPVDDLAKYERGVETDDYRHRMLVNVAAFVFVIALIGAGLWLADTMAKMRRNQDCVLSGRRGCSPVDIAPSSRY